MNDEDQRKPTPVDRLTARTSERVSQMGEAERAEVARKLAGRRRAVPDETLSPPVPLPGAPRVTPEAVAAAEAMRLSVELHRTERRLDRLERLVTRSRYQMSGGAPASGRYYRLLSRADRLERQLRRLG